MLNRRETIAGVLAGAAAIGVAAASSASAAGEPVSEALARRVITAWLAALRTGDPAIVEKVLAPEFQIQRSDGTGFGKEGYLKSLPKQTSEPTLSHVVATGADDTIVARYVVEIEQTINGKPAETISPRLSTYRKDGENWLIVAHANFAKLG